MGVDQFIDVEVSRLPPGPAVFATCLLAAGTTAVAVAAGTAASPEFDGSECLALLIATDLATGIGRLPALGDA